MSACVESVFPVLSPVSISRPTAAAAPLQAKPAANFAGPMPAVVHVSLDSFFASVEQSLNPKLQGRPVLVGRKALASFSAEARMMGVRPTMTTAEALELCPNAVVLPGRYNKYAEYAEKVRQILQTYTPAVEAGSRHDFFLDFGKTRQSDPDFRGTLLRLQMDVFDRTGLGISLGAASTKVVAELASQIDGPRGFRIVPPIAEAEFIAPLPIERLPGLGTQYASLLAASSVQTIAALRRVPRQALMAALGETPGERMWNAARGRDFSGKPPAASRGLVSRETTIEGGTIDPEYLKQMMGYLCDRVSATLRESGRVATSIGLEIAYVDQYSAKQSLRVLSPTAVSLDLQEMARTLCKNLFTRPVKVHRIRVEVTACVAKAVAAQPSPEAAELALAASV
jgi:DNA polymerase-4